MSGEQTDRLALVEADMAAGVQPLPGDVNWLLVQLREAQAANTELRWTRDALVEQRKGIVAERDAARAENERRASDPPTAEQIARIRERPPSSPPPWATRIKELESELTAARAEIARHHVDFERWERMAADGAGKGALLREAVELLRAITADDADEVQFEWVDAFLARVGSNQTETR